MLTDDGVAIPGATAEGLGFDSICAAISFSSSSSSILLEAVPLRTRSNLVLSSWYVLKLEAPVNSLRSCISL